MGKNIQVPSKIESIIQRACSKAKGIETGPKMGKELGDLARTTMEACKQVTDDPAVLNKVCNNLNRDTPSARLDEFAMCLRDAI